MSAQSPVERRYERIKRFSDIVIAAAVLVLTTPIQAAVAVLVRLSLGRPVLFRQSRPGLHGVPFTLVKFRTMRNPDFGGGVVGDAARLTRVGAQLRRLSLDELPTLWNVVRGDMSLVGPRPLLMQYLPLYSAAQAHRHDVRPGITGLAQVSGRNALTWEQKFAADLDYVQQRTSSLDLRILASTVRSVLRRDGISADGEATMSEFLGWTDASK